MVQFFGSRPAQFGGERFGVAASNCHLMGLIHTGILKGNLPQTRPLKINPLKVQDLIAIFMKNFNLLKFLKKLTI
jgi:hypothetical protein